jgi:capsular exopolysaccharide synthesis family protein
VQIDNGSPAGGGSVSDLGSDAGQLTRYVSALRLRWPILIACLALGAVVGWVTTPDPQTVTQRLQESSYYKATHTLISDIESDLTGEGGGSGANLAQAAFLVTTGEVPVRTAAKLNVPQEVIFSTVQATPRGDVASLEISAYAESPEEAVRVADTAASELVSYLGETNSNRYQNTLTELQAQVDTLKEKRTVLEQQLAITPPESRPNSTPELDSVINQYRIAYDRYSLKVAEGEPSAGLTTIQAATPIPITPGEYAAQRASIVLDDAAAAATTTTTIAADDASGLPAQPPSAASRTAAGGFLGTLIGIAIVLLLDRFDTRLRRREAVEVATGLPVLSEIPPLPRKAQHETHILAAAEPRSSTAEAYRVVRTAMVFARAPQTKASTPSAVDWSGTGNVAPPKRGEVIMVTSPNPGEGKTTSCANLAAVYAEGGQSVLVIDCDFRRPRIHKYLADDMTVATGFATGRDSSKIIAANGELKAVATDLAGVRLVTGMGEAFPDASPIEIVAYQRQVIEFAREHFDIVILDTAPFLTTNDASELLSETDVVILVVRAGKTQFASAKRASEFLQRLDAPVLGAVITGSADATAAQYYYHYYLDHSIEKKRRGDDAKANTNGSNGDGSNGNGSRGDGANGHVDAIVNGTNGTNGHAADDVDEVGDERTLDDLLRDP